MFDEIASVYFISKIYLYFRIGKKWPAQGTCTLPVVSAHFRSLFLRRLSRYRGVNIAICVCLSASISPELRVPFSCNFYACFPWPICFVLPVLWMTSYLHTMEASRHRCGERRHCVVSAPASAPAASYWSRRRRVPRLDKSVVKGVPGAELAMHRCPLLFCDSSCCGLF